MGQPSIFGGPTTHQHPSARVTKQYNSRAGAHQHGYTSGQPPFRLCKDNGGAGARQKLENPSQHRATCDPRRQQSITLGIPLSFRKSLVAGPIRANREIPIMHLRTQITQIRDVVRIVERDARQDVRSMRMPCGNSAYHIPGRPTHIHVRPLPTIALRNGRPNHRYELGGHVGTRMGSSQHHAGAHSLGNPRPLGKPAGQYNTDASSDGAGLD
jgi:hypothetical protein